MNITLLRTLAFTKAEESYWGLSSQRRDLRMCECCAERAPIWVREKLKFRGSSWGGSKGRMGGPPLDQRSNLCRCFGGGKSLKVDSGKFVGVEIKVETFSYLMILITWVFHEIGKRMIWCNGNGGEESLGGGGNVKREEKARGDQGSRRTGGSSRVQLRYKTVTCMVASVPGFDLCRVCRAGQR